MKTVGIIGGLGPGTTAEFYLDIINIAQEKNSKQRSPVLISSVPIPFEVERDLILKNIGVERFIPYLLNEAQRLEKAGAEFIVMPCNSLHMYIDELRSSVNIPVLSIIDESVKYIKKQGVQNIGIVSTAITISNKLYEKAFQTNNIKASVPSKQEQLVLDSIILNLVLGKQNQMDYDHLINVIKNFKKNNINNVILACTDLQLLNPVYQDFQIHDSMKIFAEATVEYMLH